LIYFFKEFDLKLPDYSYIDTWGENSNLYLQEYANFFRKLDKDEKLEIGDVILFNGKENPSHTGVYLGDSKFVHAYQKAGTRIDSLVNPIWKGKVYGKFRVKEG
jgi:cell wall-associated NlpC family hydrolase